MNIRVGPRQSLARAAGVLVVGLCLLLSFQACARDTGYAESVGLMQRERTLGEANAGLLKTFGKDDTATFARGIQLYALARADFDALIETLRAKLISDGELEGAKDYAADLQRAAERRVEFTDFVDEEVISKSPEGTKSIAAILGGAGGVKDASELIKVLTNAGLEIWREYKAADKEQKQQILDQLDSLKWRSFGEVPALG